MQFGYALVRRPNQVYDKNYASRKVITEIYDKLRPGW